VFAIEISGLHKHYGTHRALDGVDLRVRTGEVYGLLGPNGAGKTTLMKTVLGLRRPTSGEVRLFGRPYDRRLLTEVGALVEAPGLWPHLDAVAHLRIHARLRGVSEPGSTESVCCEGRE
jgi:lantibiotic transport system ATP-binding protein